MKHKKPVRFFFVSKSTHYSRNLWLVFRFHIDGRTERIIGTRAYLANYKRNIHKRNIAFSQALGQSMAVLCPSKDAESLT
jgi:hypothetical protein